MKNKAGEYNFFPIQIELLRQTVALFPVDIV